MVIFSSKLDEEAVNALTAKFNDLIEATQATLHLVTGASVSWLMLSIMKQKVLMYCGHSHLRLSFQLSLREFLVSERRDPFLSNGQVKLRKREKVMLNRVIFNG